MIIKIPTIFMRISIKSTIYLVVFSLGIAFQQVRAQSIELFEQFNGRYDYTAIGNTLNPYENNIVQSFCYTLDASSADLNLSTDAAVVAAYLYWAGSGSGDTNVNLNGNSIDAELTYNVSYQDTPTSSLTYFSCFADVTELIISEGNSTYTLTDLDISDVLASNPTYCSNRTNFAGWSIYIIYEDDNLPLNQINLFQGLDIIDRNVNEITIPLTNLNVIDNQNAKIGFLAWEGDNSLNYGETLSINGNYLSNPPLNLWDNAFNGTNTFTNSNTLYNMDLDVYDIQDNIQIGDSSAIIKLTTGAYDAFGTFQADLIILNNIITVLNSQLPDATIAIDSYDLDCELELVLNYSVHNTNATDVLPAFTPIAFYINDVLVAQSQTETEITIGGSESGSIQINLLDFENSEIILTLSVDDNGQGIGIVTETDETNNTTVIDLSTPQLIPMEALEAITSCNLGHQTGLFNLLTSLETDSLDANSYAFFTSESDARLNENAIFSPENYNSISSPQTIFIRIDTSEDCARLFYFDLYTENCPPRIPQGFSPNGDQINDWFNIQGLYDVFENHKLLIYNRYGTLIFEGDNDTIWDGRSNRGLDNIGKLLPKGTYFYILYLNDPAYKTMNGWVYMSY